MFINDLYNEWMNEQGYKSLWTRINGLFEQGSMVNEEGYK